MAKKTKKVEVEEPQIEETMVETVITEEPKARERLKPTNEWEIKDRMYLLKGEIKPLSRTLKATGIYYFDAQLGDERKLKYDKNKKKTLKYNWVA